jgi:hypothetical protein
MNCQLHLVGTEFHTKLKLTGRPHIWTFGLGEALSHSGLQRLHDAGMIQIIEGRTKFSPHLKKSVRFCESMTLCNWLGHRHYIPKDHQLLISVNNRRIQGERTEMEIRKAVYRWDKWRNAEPTGTEDWSFKCMFLGHTWNSKSKDSGTREVRVCTRCGIQNHRVLLLNNQFGEWRLGRGGTK